MHAYTPTGTPMHTVMGKTTGTPRLTTIADMRRLGLYPSCTTIMDAWKSDGLFYYLKDQYARAGYEMPRDGETEKEKTNE